MGSPYYSYDMPYDAIGAVSAGIITAAVISFLFVFIFYIFNAIGLYTISKRRGYKNAWLAYIPVVNSYVLGAITDNINTCYNKKSSFRIWLLVLSIVNFVVGFAGFGAIFGNFESFIRDTLIYDSLPNSNIIASIFVSSSLNWLIGIVVFVLTCICQYKIFTDYNKNNATLFLVLSILFHISPFFIFAIRNKPSASLYFANQRINPNQQQYQPPYQQQYYQTYQQPNQQSYQQPYQQPFQQPQQQPYQQPYQQPQQQPYQQPQQQPQQQPYQQPQQPINPQNAEENNSQINKEDENKN